MNNNKLTNILKDYYYDAGQFYMGKTFHFFKKNLFNNKTKALKLDKFESVDINEIEDWYFAEKLFDYEKSSNLGNWQWVAGCGVDAAPYFRIFNPHEQVKKFDKDLKYINRWVKDINKLTYPEPIVEHKFARERCLKEYKYALTPA